ncbi:MAG: type V CRISPR-associated protein Cas12b [Verrucomicrobia bacterium]|nr:type V CRISPR-associated protein Cas12b [Verrucomicrobiota bacterium]
MPTLTRVYQGRVTKAEARNASGTDAESQWCLLGFTPDEVARLETERERLRTLAKENSPGGDAARQRLAEINRQLNEPWQTVLWRHHELFQDAVNYYLSAFAAMVGQGGPKGLTEYRDAVARSWSKDVTAEESWQMRVLGLTVSGHGAWPAFEKRIFTLTGSKAFAAQRAAAVEAIFSAATDLAEEMEKPDAPLEDKLRQKGRSLFPKLKLLCARSTGTTPDHVTGAQRKLASRATWRVERGGKLRWKDVFAFKTNDERRPWTHEEAIARTQKAFDDVAAEFEERVQDAKRQEANRRQRSQAAENRATALTAAELDTLLSKFKKERDGFVRLLASPKFKPPADEPVRSGSGGFDMKAAMLLASEPTNTVFREVFLLFNRRLLDSTESRRKPTTDHVYAARHAGGVECRVFPFFCDLWASRLDDPSVELGVWPDFEKQAFIEVCNKIGQFIITTRRLELRLNIANQTIANTKEQLKRDKTLQKVEELVKALGSSRVDAQGLPLPYTIRDRTLKAWPKVRKAWRDIVKSAVGEVPAADLVAEKNRLQTRFRERFGSAALFDQLAEKGYRETWNNDDEADPLREWARFAEALEDKEHLEEQRVFTSAHPVESPRFFRWSETPNKKHWSLEGKDTPFVVDVDALDFAAKSKTRFKITYRAPRLLRDGLREVAEKIDHDDPEAEWLSPALRPVCEKHGFKPDQQSFERVAVRLAPRSKTDIQLVFEPEIVTDDLARQWRQKFPFEAWYQKPKEGDSIPRGLKWPKTEAELRALTKQPVLGLMVDLGINNAAAYHVLRMDGERGNGLAHDVGPADGKSQFVARSIENGLIRVMGEDRWVWREMTAEEKTALEAEMKKPAAKRNGFCRKFCTQNPGLRPADATHAFLPELSGSAGRNATADETTEAAMLFGELKSHGYDIQERWPQWKTVRSFPEQNDDLLWGLKRVRSQLFRLNRWGVQLNLKADAKSREAAVTTISKLRTDDPLFELADLTGSQDNLRKRIAELWQNYRRCLIELLPKVANRVLPVHRGTWKWEMSAETHWSSMVLDENRPRRKALLAGQRGVSLARLNQLRDLRQLAQSLDHLCRHSVHEHYQIRPGDFVPEPFESCRQAMEDAREDRAKQIAHDIFALALGVKLTTPPCEKKELKQTQSLHGVYRCLERGPVNFIALEDLSEYGMSGRQGRRENRQLAAWSHRRIHKILADLCQPTGLPIVYVDPSLTSRFSAKDHRAGFRAEQVARDDSRKSFWERQATEDPSSGWGKFLRLLNRLPEGKTLLLPRKGGSVFVPLGPFSPANPDAGLFHADLNAAYRIGLRALAHPDRHELFGTVMLKVVTKDGESKNRQHLIDVAGVLPRSTTKPNLPYKVAPRFDDLWDKVDGDIAWEQCEKINRARLQKWGIVLREDAPPTSVSPADDEDDIPM